MEVEIQKPEFIVGNERRFSEFISNLDEDDVIAIISHTDCDGISAAKVIDEVIMADYVLFAGYNDFTADYLLKLKEKGVTKLIISDLGIDTNFDTKVLDKFDRVLWIDHHRFENDFNSDKVIFMNSQGHCATYLAYYLFSKIQGLEKWDWLVGTACVADIMWEKNLDWIKKIFEKYGDNFEANKNVIRQSGVFWNWKEIIDYSLIYFKEDIRKVFDALINGQEGLKVLEKYSNEVSEFIKDCEERFEKEKKEINGRYYWDYFPKFKASSQISTSISLKNLDKTIIIGREEGDIFVLSCRRNDFKEDMNLLVKKLVEGLENSRGGGHIPAAGGSFMLKDKEVFLKRLNDLPPQ